MRQEAKAQLFEMAIKTFGDPTAYSGGCLLRVCRAKTFRSFVTGREYRYSPVSPLYLFGRSQDFALQRVRRSNSRKNSYSS
jgi:hypothetical protein